MKESLNGEATVGWDSRSCMTFSLQVILDVINAELIQVLYQPDGEGRFISSDCVYNSIEPPSETLFKLKSYTEANTIESELRTLNFSDSSFHGAFPFENRFYWKSIAIFEHENRVAVVNVAYLRTSKETDIDHPEIFYELLMPYLRNNVVYDSNDGFEAQKMTGILMLKLASINTVQGLFQLLNTELSNAYDFFAGTVYVMNKQTGRNCDFFARLHPDPQCDIFQSCISGSDFPVDRELDESFFQRSPDAVPQPVPTYKDAKAVDFLVPGPSAFNAVADRIDLRVNGYIVGELVLVRKGKCKRPDSRGIPLMVVYGIGLTINRLLVMEDLLRTKNDFAKLQEISRYINSDIDNPNILNVISLKLHTLFEFDHQFLAVPDSDNLYLSNICNHSGDCFSIRDSSNPALPVNDSLVRQSLFSDTPVIIDMNFLASRNLLPEYLMLKYESEICKAVMMGLRFSGKILGLWVLCFKAEHPLHNAQLALIKTVSGYLEYVLAHFELDSLRKFPNLKIN